MASDVLSMLCSLAGKVKEAYDGVQGNEEQCGLLNDQVQHVVTSLGALSKATKKIPHVKRVLKSLAETLRSATDFIEGFKKRHWIKRVWNSNSSKEKLDGLFTELDHVIQVCGFALNVSAFVLHLRLSSHSLCKTARVVTLSC